jgi:GAF domain-containing protein
MISDRLTFLRNTSLKKLGIYLLGSVLIIFLIQFFIINNKLEDLEEAELKKDFARKAQLDQQQIAYMVQADVADDQSATAELYARIDNFDHKLTLLRDGGRIDESQDFLEPLSRLPRITFDQLYLSWTTYRQNINETLFYQSTQTSTTVADSTVVADSIVVAQEVSPTEKKGKLFLAGQSLLVSKWFEKLITDLSEESISKKTSVGKWFFVFVFFDVLLLASIFILFYRYILTPLRILKQNAAARQQENVVVKNEIGELANEINEILQQLKVATEFVATIGEGKLDFDYESLDKDYFAGKNRLADSLISMQGKLRLLNDEEQKRQWANEGLTKFVDILRSSNDDLTTLGDKIIAALVKYTNSNQGGLYILNDEDDNNHYLELVSLFAFDIKKFEKQKLKLGEGILGQTFLEKETTIINHIPDEYIRITSGLGGANPKSLLIVPLKVDKEVYGIVELASFKNFEQHEIGFVEKIAETIASTLASVKMAQKSKHLIEQFQQQTEEMRAQEEEMRQNMEELQATQEEVSRKEQDYLNKIDELESMAHNSVPRVQLDQLKAEYEKRIAEQLQKLRELEARLNQQVAKADDWELANEMEKVLRIQVEALRITEEELRKK